MNACAQIKQPSHKWDSDETDLFCEILADPVNNFMANLKRERERCQKAFNSELFDSIIAEFKLQNLKKVWKMLSSKKKKRKKL